MSHEQDSALVTSNRDQNQTQQGQYPPPSQSTKRISSTAESCDDQPSDQVRSIEANQTTTNTSAGVTSTTTTTTTTKCVVRKTSLNKSTKHSNKNEKQSSEKSNATVFGGADDGNNDNNKTATSNKSRGEEGEKRNKMCNQNDMDVDQQTTTTTTTTMPSMRTATDDDNHENSSVISTVKSPNSNGVNGPDGNSPNDQDQTQTTKGCGKCCFCWCCCSFLTVNKNDDNCGKSKDSTRLEVLNGDSEPLPTLEEIRDWGESFEKLMKCSVGRDIFREFLKGEYSEENIMFWLACEELKKETNPDTIEEKARVIYEDFISILSPKEVSLDAKVRDIINRKMMEPMPHTFDEAQLQIYTLMHRDSYPRFVNSTVYRKLAQLPVPSRKGSVA